MSALILTDHARARMRQRIIQPLAVEALLAIGRGEHDHRGGIIHFFDKAARRRLERERLDRVLGTAWTPMPSWRIRAKSSRSATVPGVFPGTGRARLGKRRPSETFLGSAHASGIPLSRFIALSATMWADS